MAVQWMGRRGGREFGPMLTEQLRQLALQGQLHPTDEVCVYGTDDWRSAKAMTILFPPAPAFDERGCPISPQVHVPLAPHVAPLPSIPPLASPPNALAPKFQRVPDNRMRRVRAEISAHAVAAFLCSMIAIVAAPGCVPGAFLFGVLSLGLARKARRELEQRGRDRDADPHGPPAMRGWRLMRLAAFLGICSLLWAMLIVLI